MKDHFVIDPLVSKRQQLLLATQLCRMVLKVRRVSNFRLLVLCVSRVLFPVQSVSLLFPYLEFIWIFPRSARVACSPLNGNFVRFESGHTDTPFVPQTRFFITPAPALALVSGFPLASRHCPPFRPPSLPRRVSPCGNTGLGLLCPWLRGAGKGEVGWATQGWRKLHRFKRDVLFVTVNRAVGDERVRVVIQNSSAVASALHILRIVLVLTRDGLCLLRCVCTGKQCHHCWERRGRFLGSEKCGWLARKDMVVRQSGLHNYVGKRIGTRLCRVAKTVVLNSLVCGMGMGKSSRANEIHHLHAHPLAVASLCRPVAWEEITMIDDDDKGVSAWMCDYYACHESADVKFVRSSV
ncbi:hypothetical protein BCR34DRAFT_124862 [Clohesyomyces aquaticus]|uniref:Uncharacterized protein n=1 Tax=Clohesyomyces aquaticus TaxID=1231657 RepID=A0A1Y1YNP0_9PLEO|nr:hypothetical protein BCR34DRAFT_124862 [Clohesyomyces aquaticus]